MIDTYVDKLFEIPEPKFDSKLTDLIIELDYLRNKPLQGTTNPEIFFQLKNIFHMMESIGSARIEGNRTTIAEYIESHISDSDSKDENIVEIINSVNAMEFIDENINNTSINRAFISELHKTVVNNLTLEGSKTPGYYRKNNVKIAQSKHIPPDYTQIDILMNKLYEMINKAVKPKYDLIKTAIAHHRFAWIHPFDNGNGRTVRLLTYAMLLKQGFNVGIGRILNPTAIFCINRNNYYDHLGQADQDNEQGILDWCEYLLEGLNIEINKIDKLLDYNYLTKNILFPAIAYAKERENITDKEKKILDIGIKKQIFQSSDLKDLFPGKVHTERSRVLKKLKDNKMIKNAEDHERKYVVSFDNNYLLRSIIKTLGENKFLSID